MSDQESKILYKGKYVNYTDLSPDEQLNLVRKSLKGEEERRKDYRRRFGDISPYEALARVVRSLELEEEAKFCFERSNNLIREYGLYDLAGPGLGAGPVGISSSFANSRVKEIRGLLGYYPGGERDASATNDISDAIDAISIHTGRDYSWLKEIIWESPRHYLRSKGENLSTTQRKLLLKFMSSEEHGKWGKIGQSIEDRVAEIKNYK